MKIPARIKAKAQQVRQRMEAGQIHPRKMREKGFYSVEVGRCYRLLSRDNGQTWELMTHERYSRICSPGGQHA